MTKFRSPMLASDFDPERLVFPLLASPKIDGIRCVIDVNENGLADPYSRSGKVIRNKYIQQCIGLTPLIGLDGELTVGDAAAPNVMHVTSSGVMSADGQPEFTFWVFDIRNSYEDYNDRHSSMLRLMAEFGNHQHIKVLPQTLIGCVADLEAFEADQLALGFEGIMVRDPTTLYKYGRSTPKGRELLKVKRTAQDEAEIIGFEEQMYNGNEAFTDELGRTKRSSSKDGLVPADTLGAFICRNQSKWEPDFKVAPGILTAAEAKELWDKRHSYIGRHITFRHLPHGAKDRPRHGRFYGIRHDDDMSNVK